MWSGRSSSYLAEVVVSVLDDGSHLDFAFGTVEMAVDKQAPRRVFSRNCIGKIGLAPMTNEVGIADFDNHPRLVTHEGFSGNKARGAQNTPGSKLAR
jgi:hypothetical protein